MIDKNEDVDGKILDVTVLVTRTVLSTKIGEIENEMPDSTGLVVTTVLNTKNGEVERKYQMLVKSRKQVMPKISNKEILDAEIKKGIR